MSKKNVTPAPRSGSARRRESRQAEAERSKSLFRATVPVGELERCIDRQLSQARREAKGPFPEVTEKYSSGFYHGEIFALEKLKQWLVSQPREQAPARNAALCRPADSEAGAQKGQSK